MDFVISRVAMSVCALLVAGVLSGAVSLPQFEGEDIELRGIVEGFCGTAEDVAGSSSEVELTWTVPSLASGAVVGITVGCGLVTAESGDSRAMARPGCGIHLWEWDGTTLNRSHVEALDDGSLPLLVQSGDSMLLKSITVDFEGFSHPMLFVSVCG
ncbi:MAG: hypothetical protein MUC90_06555 [Thermoplasmata archaeon]|jgi:hypothetical protein|nr:hypothetical protein [Thermoplasmata archaeon]